jgi:asparagine synthase (glutamine-hydrolysing)
MCGICGVYNFARDDTVDAAVLDRMTDILTHRGPDDHGAHVDGRIGLGVRRLAIIDVEGGHQPMAGEGGRTWIVYNGEVYNHIELREALARKGHTYKTAADTETVLHQYEEDGVDCLHAFNGMFAFAIWDADRERLFLARDRIGIKPLYYAERDGTLLFASEIKSLLLHPAVQREINWRAAVDYLTYQNILGDKTFFAGVKSLLPGHYLVCDADGPRTAAYWDISFREDASLTEEGAVARYRDLLRDSVRLRLRSDVPVGCHLSGGMDSSAVVTYAARQSPSRLKTFTAKFVEEAYDESAYSHRVVDVAGTDHVEREVVWKDLPGLLRDIVWALDEPRVGPGVIPQYLVAKMVGEHVKVVLTGHGGDELFAGYPAYLVPYVNECLSNEIRSGKLAGVVQRLPGRLREEGIRRLLGLPLYSLLHDEIRRYGHEHVFDREELDHLLTRTGREAASGYDPDSNYEALLAKTDARGELNRLFYLDFKTYLPSLLAVEDRCSMAFSVEARVPILDHRMAEFSASIPACLKIENLTLKSLPRKAMDGVLPREVIDHRKMGFPVPIAEWFRTTLRSLLEETLLGPRARDRGYLNREYVGKLIREHAAGRKDHSEKLWCLLNLEMWCRVFLDGDGFAEHPVGGRPPRKT